MNVADRRYSTARWQKLRRLVLDRDGHICRIQRPRCRGIANTVHHILPSSQYPGLFWEPENLEAACGPCNYAGGSYTKAENQRSSREQIAYLEHVIEVLEGRLDELAAALARERNGSAAPNGRKRANPAIR
jgi:5-methylcytosine-specific restriction endonuclease McrA